MKRTNFSRCLAWSRIVMGIKPSQRRRWEQHGRRNQSERHFHYLRVVHVVVAVGHLEILLLHRIWAKWGVGGRAKTQIHFNKSFSSLFGILFFGSFFLLLLLLRLARIRFKGWRIYCCPEDLELEMANQQQRNDWRQDEKYRRVERKKIKQRLWLEYRSTKTKVGAIEKSPQYVGRSIISYQNIDGKVVVVVVGWLHFGQTWFGSTERKNLMATFIDAVDAAEFRISTVWR